MKKLFTVAMIVSVGFSASADYESEHYNDDFFKNVRVWHLQTKSAEDTDDMFVPVTVKVEGDVTISGKYEIMPGYFEDGTVTCKQLSITEEGKEPRYVGAFEMLNKIFAYSEKLGQFELVADFSAQEGGKVSIWGAEWTADRVDYVEAAKLLQLRTELSHDGSTHIQVYGIGTNKLHANIDNWDNPGYFEFVSCEMADGSEVTADVFSLPTFVPTNEYYTIGKGWFIENYDTADENNKFYTTQRVTDDIEFAHMPCRRVSTISTETNGESGYYVGCDYDGYVYKFDEECRRLRLALNFNIEVGDLAVEGDEMSEVTVIDTVEVEGTVYKRIKFKGADNESNFWRYWVDGIGASNGNILIDEPRPTGMMEKMNMCLINGECVFRYDDFSKTSGVEAVDCPVSTDKQQPMYNLSGQRVNKTAKGEIYITNGQKHIAQ